MNCCTITFPPYNEDSTLDITKISLFLIGFFVHVQVLFKHVPSLQSADPYKYFMP